MPCILFASILLCRTGGNGRHEIGLCEWRTRAQGQRVAPMVRVRDDFLDCRDRRPDTQEDVSDSRPPKVSVETVGAGSPNFAHAAELVIFERFLNFGAAVHDEWALADDRLGNWFAGHH